MGASRTAATLGAALATGSATEVVVTAAAAVVGVAGVAAAVLEETEREPCH